MARPKGARNNPKQALIALLQTKYPGYQPVMKIAEAAHKLTVIAEAEGTSEAWRDAGAMHERVAQYVTPKLKALEVTGEDGGPIVVQVVKHSEE